MRGIGEMEELLGLIRQSGELSAEVELDLSLARGMNYYTGTIIEVKAADVEIGSICGGGRYDDLAGIFGMQNLSGVGRIVWRRLVFSMLCFSSTFFQQPARLHAGNVYNFGKSEAAYCLKAFAAQEQVVSAEIYPDSTKMKKQLDYDKPA
jgi:histidyl-tRNA synthetase